VKQTVQLGALSAANIIISFLFQWYVLTKLGPGMETDALFAGMTIPQLVLAIISGSLMHVLVPILAGEDEDCLRHDAWCLLALVGGLFGALAVLLFIAAPWWIPLTVPGFDEAGKVLTVELTRIQLIGMVFAAINGVQWAAYHARQQFVWAESIQILANLLALLLLVWALPRFGVIAAAWISSLRMALQTLLLAPGMGMPVWPDVRSPAIFLAWQRIKPLLLGAAYYKTDPLVDCFLLSTSASGSLSLYYLAQQIYGAVSQVLNKSIATPLVPRLSKFHKSGDLVSFRRLYHQKFLQTGIISLLGIFVFGLIGQGMLNLLVGYGNISGNNIAELWWIMIWLSGMFVGGAMGQLSSSAFYAFGDTTTPTRIGIYSYTFYIPLKLILFHYFGVMGLALVTSTFLLVNLCLQSIQLRKIIALNS
jgi:putative peptidoglycan lipid II flippase